MNKQQLVNAYLVVGELNLPAPGADVHVDTSVSYNIDVSWIGKWYTQRVREWSHDPSKRHITERNCFIRSRFTSKADMSIRRHQATIQLLYLADIAIQDNDIVKCRPHLLEEIDLALQERWRTYCYYAANGQIDMLITARILQGDSTSSILLGPNINTVTQAV